MEIPGISLGLTLRVLTWRLVWTSGKFPGQTESSGRMGVGGIPMDLWFPQVVPLRLWKDLVVIIPWDTSKGNKHSKGPFTHSDSNQSTMITWANPQRGDFLALAFHQTSHK